MYHHVIIIVLTWLWLESGFTFCWSEQMSCHKPLSRRCWLAGGACLRTRSFTSSCTGLRDSLQIVLNHCRCASQVLLRVDGDGSRALVVKVHDSWTARAVHLGLHPDLLLAERMPVRGACVQTERCCRWTGQSRGLCVHNLGGLGQPSGALRLARLSLQF